MNPYSHLVLAARLQDTVQPANLPDYYWGTVAPDVRYTAGLARTKTHLPLEKILKFRAAYPELESFIQGYLIHCLADEVELWALLERRWFLRPFVRHLPLKLAPVILESYLVEKNPIKVSISGQTNPILRALGANEKAILEFHSLVERIINQPSFDSVLHLFETLGRGNPYLQKYLEAADRFNRDKISKNILYSLTSPLDLLYAVEKFVREQPVFVEVCQGKATKCF